MPENNFDHYNPINLHVQTSSDRLTSFRDVIYSELFPERSEKKKKSALLVVLAELYKTYKIDTSRYLGVSLDNNAYLQSERYNNSGFGVRPLRTVVYALFENNYIELVDGFYDRRTQTGRTSRIRALNNLIERIETHNNEGGKFIIPPHQIYISKDAETIVLKNAEKKKTEYGDTPETNRMRKDLKKYNELLSNKFIDIDLRRYSVDDGENLIIDTTMKWVYRSFNNESFDDGGRFYGGWWQNIKKELRARIVMDETCKPTIEIDYKAIHIIILYALAGIDYFAEYGQAADPYTTVEMQQIENESEKRKWRAFYKKVLLISVSVKSETGAVIAVTDEIDKHIGDGTYPDIDRGHIEDAINVFKALHEPISQFFNTGMGVKLQKMDSMIAEKIIQHFVKEDLPLLCMHDSFICTTRDENHLRDMIDKAYRETIMEIGNLRDGGNLCRPVTTYRNLMAEEQEKERDLNPYLTFVEDDISTLLAYKEENGSPEARAELWKSSKAQTIIIFNNTNTTTIPPTTITQNNLSG